MGVVVPGVEFSAWVRQPMGLIPPYQRCQGARPSDPARLIEKRRALTGATQRRTGHAQCHIVGNASQLGILQQRLSKTWHRDSDGDIITPGGSRHSA